MKTYEKPMLTVLSLSGNDRLCGDCTDQGATELLCNNEFLAKQLMDFNGFGDATDGIDKNDFAGVFGENEHQCTKVQIKSYCKFNSTGEKGLVAWS